MVVTIFTTRNIFTDIVIAITIGTTIGITELSKFTLHSHIGSS